MQGGFLVEYVCGAKKPCGWANVTRYETIEDEQQQAPTKDPNGHPVKHLGARQVDDLNTVIEKDA